jgi:hypothetical protein
MANRLRLGRTTERPAIGIDDFIARAGRHERHSILELRTVLECRRHYHLTRAIHVTDFSPLAIVAMPSLESLTISNGGAITPSGVNEPSAFW